MARLRGWFAVILSALWHSFGLLWFSIQGRASVPAKQRSLKACISSFIPHVSRQAADMVRQERASEDGASWTTSRAS
jgi:hypothetical protein